MPVRRALLLRDRSVKTGFVSRSVGKVSSLRTSKLRTIRVSASDKIRQSPDDHRAPGPYLQRGSWRAHRATQANVVGRDRGSG